MDNTKKYPVMDVDIPEDAKIVYICSPYAGKTPKEVENNVNAAKNYSRFAISTGHVPYCAHLAVCSYLDDDVPAERNLGIKADGVMMKNCAELWVFGDKISTGMSFEIKYFEEHNKPILYFTEDCALKKH